MKLSEADVEAAFAAHLDSEGWDVSTTNSNFTDLIARRHDELLIAEIKGHTKSPGAAVDIGFGQLLRRMDPSLEPCRYALVGPASLRWHIERVKPQVRARLGVQVFLVDDDHRVIAI